MKNFDGDVFFIDRNDINTDEIIPAKYLTEIEKEALKPHLLEDLNIENFSLEKIKNKKALITRDNFGCGSSREHAPWAFEVNDINIIVGEGFARIFKQNMFNCGMLAITLKKEEIDAIFEKFSDKIDVKIKTNFKETYFVLTSQNEEMKVNFSLTDFEKELIEAEGWVNYADKNY